MGTWTIIGLVVTALVVGFAGGAFVVWRHYDKIKKAESALRGVVV